MVVLADTALTPAVVGFFGVAAGAAITATVPVISERMRARDSARRRFACAAYFVLQRASKIRTAVAAFATISDAEGALRKSTGARLEPKEEIIRNEVYLLAEDLNALVNAFADVRAKSRPTLDELEGVNGPLREVTILHRMQPVQDETVTSALARWSKLAG